MKGTSVHDEVSDGVLTTALIYINVREDFHYCLDKRATIFTKPSSVHECHDDVDVFLCLYVRTY